MGGAYKLHYPHPPTIYIFFHFIFLISNQKTLYIHLFYRLLCGLDCQWARRDTSDTSLDYSVEGATALQTSLLWLVGQRSHELVWIFRQCFVVGSCLLMKHISYFFDTETLVKSNEPWCVCYEP